MMQEQQKYEQMWSHSAYRAVAPGEYHVDNFIELAHPQRYQRVIDFGCGTGRAAFDLSFRTSVLALDFAENCLDDDVRAAMGETLQFRQHDLTQPVALPVPADFGFCTDVLEHIPPEDVDKVLLNIGTAARRVYFAISTVDDVMGALIGEPLHLTVRDEYWWHEKLTELSYRVDWSRAGDGVVCFYASMYANGQDFADVSGLNTAEEQIRENIKRNIALGFKQFVPHEVQPDTIVYLLAGGPSLNDHAEQIIAAGKAGTPIVTVNGTYNWLIERGVRPAAQVMMDARGFNRRFLEPLVDTCQYLLSSQCDHDAIKHLPAERTWLWHSDSLVTREAMREVDEEAGVSREFYPVYGGSTVISRALVLLAMLGFRKVEVFGWDSCLRDDAHHAYSQPENDSTRVTEIEVGGHKFRCHSWMVVQAHEFPKVVKHILGKIEDFDLQVHGDGLIAALLNHAADLADLKGAD